MSENAFDRFHDNPAADQFDPAYTGEPVNPMQFADSVYQAVQPTTALAAALASAGMSAPSPAYGGPRNGVAYPGPQPSTDSTPPWVKDPAQPRSTFYNYGTPDDISDDRVYFGKEEITHTPGPSHMTDPRHADDPELGGQAPYTTHREANSITVSAAMNRPYLWDNEKVDEVMTKMRHAGLKVETFDDMMGVWQSMVTRASRAFTMSHGKKEVTPWDILSSMKKENIAAGVLDKDGNIVQKSVSKSVNEVSDADAWATLRSSMEQMLGRKPTDQEVLDFASRANAMAAKNPSITTTTSTTNAETGHTDTSSNTEGGFTSNDAQEMATNQLEGTDEFAQVQSATTYMNALLSAIGETAGPGA